MALPIQIAPRRLASMPYQELLILLPCHSLEDFPTYHEGDDAQSLLSSWSALWHPELLAAAGKAPTWRRIEDPPSDVKDKLIVVPTVCVSRLPTGFSQRVKDEGGTLIRKTSSRAEILSAALSPSPPLPLSPSSETGSQGPGAGGRVDPDLAADFLALGYCYLQIELLTRQMRYSSNLDETYFKGTALAAATAAVEGNTELAREKLSACFNVLAEERDHYYPVDAFVLDLNLTAKTTLGGALRQELSRETPTNVLLSGELLADIAAREPATLAALKDGLTAGRIGLIGGEAREERLPLLSNESILAALQQGLAIYKKHLDTQPQVYGRWRYGLTPNLPGILLKLGFRGALHAGFEEGKTPDGLQFKVRWEGLDGSAIDAIARTPLDASKPQTFLAFATKMGESMDSDHVATLCLAHWPGQASEWLDDLRRIARYSAALGKWVTVDDYFAGTDMPGQLDRFEADRYRSPYLKQAVIRRQDDPVSTQIRYWQRQTTLAAAEAMETLSTLVTGRVVNERGRGGEGATRTQDSPTLPLSHSPTPALTEVAPPETDAAVEVHFAAATQQLTDALTIAEPNNSKGTLVINPSSFVRRIGIDDAQLSGRPTVERPVYSVDQHAGAMQAVVDVPAFGFVHLAPGKPASREKKTILLAEEGVLRNEFFEAIINPTTGSLAAIHEYKSRGNRLSQQLALRMPAPKQKPGDTYRDPDAAAWYSVMAADSVETTIATTALGEIVVRGRLLDQQGNRLAGFVQVYRLWRGSRVLHVEIELDTNEEPKADPWNSYYCCRWAWADEGAELFRTVNQRRQAVVEKRFEAPHYVEISAEPQSTTILAGGLAFHRRHEERMLDTLLVTRGERQRKFRLGIGVDLAHPLHEALGILAPPVVVPHVRQPASGSAGWLLHLSARNVIATSLAPLVESGQVVGFRVRLLETVGRPANLAITPFRRVKAASTVDFQGNALHECRLEDDKIRLDLAAHEWVEVAARW